MKIFLEYLAQHHISHELIELATRDMPDNCQSFTVIPADLDVSRQSTVLETTLIPHTSHQMVFLSTPDGFIQFSNKEEDFWAIAPKDWKQEWTNTVHQIKKPNGGL